MSVDDVLRHDDLAVPHRDTFVDELLPSASGVVGAASKSPICLDDSLTGHDWVKRIVVQGVRYGPIRLGPTYPSSYSPVCADLPSRYLEGLQIDRSLELSIVSQPSLHFLGRYSRWFCHDLGLMAAVSQLRTRVSAWTGKTLSEGPTKVLPALPEMSIHGQVTV